MNREIAAGEPQPVADKPGNQSTPMHGPALTAARAGWLAIAMLSAVLFLTSLPNRFHQLSAACAGDACAAGQLPIDAFDSIHKIGLTPGWYAAYSVALSLFSALIFFGLAALIFSRRSNDRFALLASLWLVTFGTADSATGLQSGPQVLSTLAGLVDTLGWAILLPLFLLTFPDGRFIPRRSGMVFLVYLVLGLLAPAVTGPDAGRVLAMGAWFGMQLTGIAAQIYRFRAVSNPAQRQQTRWVVFGLVAAAAVLAAFTAVRSSSVWPAGPPGLFDRAAETAITTGAFLLIPVAIAVSILRHRLWEIDRLINHSLVYGSLTGILLIVYILVIGGAGALLNASGNLLLSMLATGLIAVLFNPLRLRLQRGINTFMYGQQDDPYAVLSRLVSRLESVIAPDAVIPAIVETVSETFRLDYVALALIKGGEYRVAASVGVSEDGAFVVPISHHGEVLGELICGSRPRGRPFGGMEKKLLADIAGQAGAALQAVRLTGDLRRARERLIIVQEEERRRIRRDLHDELGPALASQTLRIGSARALVRTDPDAADRLLGDLEKDTTGVLGHLRRIVHDLRPPALDELGLRMAIEQSAPSRLGLKTTYDFPPAIPDLPAAVEAAVYRIVQEALTNTVRHSGARRAGVSLVIDSEVLLRITDDGCGIASGQSSGVGLQSMRERAEELGGSFEMITGPGNGVIIETRLPLRQG